MAYYAQQPGYAQGPPGAQPYYAQQGGYGPQGGYAQQPGYNNPGYQSRPQSAYAPPPNVSPNVVAWFHSIDTDRSGTLDAKELQRALALGNLNYGLTDVDQMVRAFDTKGARTLTVQEFSKLHEFLMSVTTSFQYFDADRSGTLAPQEVTQALKHAGFQLDPPVVQAMFKKHDPDNTGTLSLDEYIRMCLFLQSCVRTFSAFDVQHAGRITLDFNQFVYASSHVA